MPTQPDLIAGQPDPFAEARLESPGCKYIRCIHTIVGIEFVIAVPPGSPWFDLLPETQTVEIQVAMH